MSKAPVFITLKSGQHLRIPSDEEEAEIARHIVEDNTPDTLIDDAVPFDELPEELKASLTGPKKVPKWK